MRESDRVKCFKEDRKKPVYIQRHLLTSAYIARHKLIVQDETLQAPKEKKDEGEAVKYEREISDLRNQIATDQGEYVKALETKDQDIAAKDKAIADGLAEFAKQEEVIAELRADLAPKETKEAAPKKKKTPKKKTPQKTK